MRLRKAPASGRGRLLTAVRSLVAVLGVITPLGRWALVTGVLAVAVGWRLGWVELMLAGLTLLVVLVAAVPWTLGGGPRNISVSADPARVTVGEPAVARVISSASLRSGARGLRVEVPMTSHWLSGIGVVDLPAVGAGEVARRDLPVPTDRRAVVRLGPIQAVRADPIGLARRAVAGGGQATVHVWPRVVRVPSTGGGVLRDLEGRVTSDPSPSDAAFHALREYAPGDDRRHVHWRTSMRLGKIMVRQFVDVRRSDLSVVCGVDPDDYADAEEFETAMGVVASIAVRALTDQVGLRLFLDGPIVPGRNHGQVLDALAEVTSHPVPTTARPGRVLERLGRQTRGDIVVVTGSRLALSELAGAAAGLGPDVIVTAVRVAHGELPARSRVGRVEVVQLGGLDDLTRVLRPTTAFSG